VDPISQRDRAYPTRISDAERARVADRITAGWSEGVSVDHSFATARDDGVMVASRRSWWRIAAQIKNQSVRPIAPTRRGSSRPPEGAPVLVGWRVEDGEVDDLGVEIYENAFAREGLPEVVHADSGPAMRSTVLKDLLADLEITQTHNRPRVSNDNPFSESEFRPMKYRPNYPGTFPDIEQARAVMGGYVSWYNTNHKHSGIALFAPNEVHDGT